MDSIKPYKKDFDHSYTLGAFPTVELLKTRPEMALGVYLHSSFVDTVGVCELCACAGVRVEMNDRAIARVSSKENIFVVGVFRKFDETLDAAAPHILLDHPGDMGNLGTIIRTAVGFGIHDLAVIRPAADVWNPKTVRASMGAVFRLRHRVYDDFNSYRADHPSHAVYCFMLDGAVPLTRGFVPPSAPYTLVFGNEGSGLSPEYKERGTCVFIPQSPDVDSLNLPVAAAIGMFVFAT